MLLFDNDRFKLRMPPSVHPKSRHTAGGATSSALELAETAPEQRSKDAAAGEQTVAQGVTEEEWDFPEGGFRANLVVFGSFMGLIPAFGLINSVGAIQSYVSVHQLAHVSTSTVSWIFSIYSFIAFFSSIYSGTFFDRKGAFKPMLIGTITFWAGLFSTANAKTVYQFVLAFGVVCGFGTGMLMSPLIGSVSHYFNKRRGAATSIATIGGSVGGIIMPLMLRRLYATVGFQWALRVVSFFCLGCLCCSLVLTRERYQQGTEKVDSVQKFLKVYVFDVFDYKSFKEVQFLACTFAISLTESSLVVVMVYYPSYAIMRGISEDTSSLLIITLNACSVLGRFIPGLISDYLGRFNVVIFTVSMCAILSLALWLPFGDSLKVLYVFASFYGFFSGSILSLTPVCIGQISRTEEFGRRYSTMYLIAALSMLVFVPVAGAIIGDGSVKEYNNCIIYTAVLLIAGVACHLTCRYQSVGLKLCKF